MREELRPVPCRGRPRFWHPLVHLFLCSWYGHGKESWGFDSVHHYYLIWTCNRCQMEYGHHDPGGL